MTATTPKAMKRCHKKIKQALGGDFKLDVALTLRQECKARH